MGCKQPDAETAPISVYGLRSTSMPRIVTRSQILVASREYSRLVFPCLCSPKRTSLL